MADEKTLEAEVAEFLATLDERPLMNPTRYPRTARGRGALAPEGPAVKIEKRPGGFERAVIAAKPRPTPVALCSACFERTELTMSGREFCVVCASEARVVYVEPDYSGAGDKRRAELMPNGKRRFMF